MYFSVFKLSQRNTWRNNGSVAQLDRATPS